MITRRTLLQAGVGMALGTTVAPLLSVKDSLAGGQEARGRRLLFTVPVPTPLSQDLSLDLGAHRQLLEFYRRAGAHAVLAVASTGEMLSISWPEALQLTRQASAVFGPRGTWASLSRGSTVAACRSGIRQLARAGAGTAIVVPGLLAAGLAMNSRRCAPCARAPMAERSGPSFAAKSARGVA